MNNIRLEFDGPHLRAVKGILDDAFTLKQMRGVKGQVVISQLVMGGEKGIISLATAGQVDLRKQRGSVLSRCRKKGVRCLPLAEDERFLSLSESLVGTWEYRAEKPRRVPELKTAINAGTPPRRKFRDVPLPEQQGAPTPDVEDVEEEE